MAIRDHMSLVALLHDLTKNNKIEWQVSPTDSLITVVNGNTVAIKSIQTGPFEEDFYISIFNADGNLVETFSDIELKSAGFDNAYSLMKELHELARRNALGADKVLNSIIETLRQKR